MYLIIFAPFSMVLRSMEDNGQFLIRHRLLNLPLIGAGPVYVQLKGPGICIWR